MNSTPSAVTEAAKVIEERIWAVWMVSPGERLQRIPDLVKELQQKVEGRDI